LVVLVAEGNVVLEVVEVVRAAGAQRQRRLQLPFRHRLVGTALRLVEPALQPADRLVALLQLTLELGGARFVMAELPELAARIVQALLELCALALEARLALRALAARVAAADARSAAPARGCRRTLGGL